MFFQKKSLMFDSDSVGQQLRCAREQKNLKIEVVAKKLIIKVDYLKALEDNDKTKLPTGVYAKNFLREYARFLGLDYKSLLKEFSGEVVLNEDKNEALFERQVVAKKYLIAIPALIRNLLIGLAALLCLIYIVFLINKIFQAPRLIVSYPASDFQTTKKDLEIVGQTESESDVQINGQDVQVSNDGSFKKNIYLERGLNTIIVSAKKKHSRSARLTRRILFEDNTPSLNSAN
ncbi:MAG: helix-turn-helix domain-containing protein [Candidatus Falkowbacteria bacterium]|nr:helix-turn-helix domain-containing protein [Candidatus Falkowbacteria bacterium]